MVAAISSHQLSLPPIQLSQVLRPASRFKPAAQHISNPSSHPAINPSTSPINPNPNQSINQSASLSPSHSIQPSIHPLLPASRCFRSVEPARNQSIDPSVPINHHQPESDRRLRLRQSINRSINPINRSINQALNHVIIQSFNR